MATLSVTPSHFYRENLKGIGVLLLGILTGDVFIAVCLPSVARAALARSFSSTIASMIYQLC
jgi:hypothetical protein